MEMVSILIPSRNETHTQKTIENILENAVEDIEIIAVLDGYWPDPPIKDEPRVNVIHHTTARGQRQSVNEAARMARGKYIMKLDGHCAVASGFDKVLKEDCQYEWTMVPTMYNLDIDTFKPKMHKKTDYMFIGNAKGRKLRAEYYTGIRPNGSEIDDTMCCMGPGWFMHKDRFWELGGMDENHGGWGQMGVEVSLKAWLSGGALKVNKKTWFAHWFRGGGGPGFPYSITQKEVDSARDYSRDLWYNNKWPQQKRTLKWLVDKFNPPTWNNDINVLMDTHKDQVCNIVGTGPSLLNVTADMFSDGPVIAINESVEYVEKLGLPNKVYAMMKDGGDKRKCPDCKERCGHLIRPNKAALILSKEQSKDCQPDYPERYIFDRAQFFDSDVISAQCAIRIAMIFGCKEIKMIGCDSLAYDNIDTRRITHNNKIEHRKQTTLIKHRERIKKYVKKKNLKVEYAMPFDAIEEFRKADYDHIIMKRRLPKWRGIDIIKQPSDLILYHQAIWKNKPDVIIETGTNKGGSALFFADMLELTGKGHVVSIDINPGGQPDHPKIIYLKGSSIDYDIFEQVKSLVVGTHRDTGKPATCMVVLDSDHSRKHVKWELHKYSSLVTPGQFLVVEDCYKRGRNKLHYPGEARDWFLSVNRNFKLTNYDKQFIATSTRGGWLCRV